tara:strand:- start:875 stop:1273 length:399 start_codon:yes stop_codon:yes gene_type:complete
MSSDIQQTIINLNANKQGIINESFIQAFGDTVKSFLKYMFKDAPPAVGPTVSQRARAALREEEIGLDAPRARIVGTPTQISAFGNALSKEKKYMETFLKHGLNDPRSFASHAELNKAVANFEKETGIKWPLK